MLLQHIRYNINVSDDVKYCYCWVQIANMGDFPLPKPIFSGKEATVTPSGD